MLLHALAFCRSTDPCSHYSAPPKEGMWLSQWWFIPIFSSPILTRERSLYFPHDDNETRVNCHHVIQNITGPATQKAGYVCFNGGSCQLVIYFAGFQLQSQPKRRVLPLDLVAISFLRTRTVCEVSLALPALPRRQVARPVDGPSTTPWIPPNT